MAVPPPSPDKPALRRALRLARARFAGDPAGIAAGVLPWLHGVASIGGYAAHRGEPDLFPILRAAIVGGAAVTLPLVTDAGTMRFVAWGPDDPLNPGHAGIAEPADGAAIVPELVLVPLLGFDRAGRRLGQGGGHYDRWCAAHPHVRRIGVAWSVQEVDAVPEEAWDVRLHAIVTERGTIAP